MASLLFHSVVRQYLAAEVRDSPRATLAAAGAAPTSDQPFAWLRMLPSLTQAAGMQEVRLALWPGARTGRWRWRTRTAPP